MQKVKHIICATDLSKFSHDLFSLGVELSSGFDAGFTVFHAIPPPRGSVARQVEFERGGEKKEEIENASKQIKRLMQGFKIKWDIAVTYGDPVIETEKAANRMRADLVMAASHGLSVFQRFFAGSIIGRMAQTISNPFLVIPPVKRSLYQPRKRLKFTNIIIACSLMESDDVLKQYARQFSEKFNSNVCLVHVMETPLNANIVKTTAAPYATVQKKMEEKLSLQLKNLMQAETQLLRGVPGEELVLYAKTHPTDLIIAGVDHRRGRISTTTTQILLRYLPCAVLTIPVDDS